MAIKKIKFGEKTKKGVFSRSFVIILFLILQCIILGGIFL